MQMKKVLLWSGKQESLSQLVRGFASRSDMAANSIVDVEVRSEKDEERESIKSSEMDFVEGDDTNSQKPMRVSIMEKKTSKSKEAQIEDSISRWFGAADAPPSPVPSGASQPSLSPTTSVAAEFEILEDISKSRVGGVDPNSLRARDIQNLKQRGLDWVDDDAHATCHACHVPFTVVVRRHHCRLCGRIFCGDCCPPNKEVPFPAILNHNYPVRACCLCYSADSFDAHTDTILGITSLSSGEVVSTSADKTIRMWEIMWEIDDSSGGQCIATLCGHTSPVMGAVELEPGKIVSVSMDKTLKVWKLNEKQKGGLVVNCFGTLRCADALHSVLVTPDKKIICGTSSGNILVCRVSKDEEVVECIGKLKGHTEAINCLELHENSKYLMSGSSDHTVKFWDLSSDACLATLSGHTGPVNSIALIPGTQGCFVSGSTDTTLRIWKVVVSETPNGPTGTPKFLASLNGHKDAITHVRISKNLYIVSASLDSSIVMWGLETGKIICKFMGHLDGVTAMYAMPSGLILSGSADKTMRVWKYTPPQK